MPHRHNLPTKRDYAVAAAGLILLTGICVGLYLVADALNYHPSDEHRSIMQAARMLAEQVGR